MSQLDMLQVCANQVTSLIRRQYWGGIAQLLSEALEQSQRSAAFELHRDPRNVEAEGHGL